MYMVEEELYEYIAVYVDDLCIAAQDPKELIDILKSKYKPKVNGDVPLTYHLGADYYHDPDGTMNHLKVLYHPFRIMIILNWIHQTF